MAHDGVFKLQRLVEEGGAEVLKDVRIQVFFQDIVGAPNLVVGPPSSTDNAIARFDGTTGNLIQNSSILISDNGDLSLKQGNIWIEGTTSSGGNSKRLIFTNATHSVEYGSISANTAGDLFLYNGQKKGLFFGNNGIIKPNDTAGDAGFDLGEQTRRWGNVYARDIFSTTIRIKHPTNGNNNYITISGSPTAARTVTLQDKAGTIALLSDIEALDYTDSAVVNQYVSAINQVDGKISVTRATLPTPPNPTDYYWANIKVSSSSSEATQPTFKSATIKDGTSSARFQIGANGCVEVVFT